MHSRIAATTRGRAVEARACRSSRTARAWRGGRPRWPAAARCPATHPLVAQEPVQRASTSPRTARASSSALDRRGLRPELVERRRRQLGGPVDAPHAGAPLGALLGQQQRRGDRRARRSNTKRAWPPRGFADCLASTSSRPPCIRWTTNVTRLEPHEQVLAAPADLLQRLPVGLVGRRHRRLEGGERERHEPLQALPGEVGGQPLGVGLDLGHLGHRRAPQSYSVRSRTSANTASRAPNTGCASSSRCWSPNSRMLAVDERLLGVELAGGDGDGGRPRCSMRTCSGSAAPAPNGRRRRRPGGGT